VQQSLLEMHEFEAMQRVSPPGHWQVPPGIGQISPGTKGQSEQHVPVGMQTSPAMQASCPPGHVNPHAAVPATTAQVWFAAHTVPQAPQLLLSVPRFAQYGAPPSPAPESVPG